jgi:hypothetical protein
MEKKGEDPQEPPPQGGDPRASDKDLGRDGTLRYHIQDGSGLGVFTIDEETGTKM